MVFMGEELDNNEKYFIYRDLETIETIYISENENDSFKESNKIIYIDLSNKDNVEEKYFDLRKKFFIELYNNGQDIAIEKVVKSK